MGLSKITSNSMGTNKTVLGTGSMFVNEGTPRPRHGDSLLQLDGEQICSGPWDGDCLFARLSNREHNREYTKYSMEELISYLSRLLEDIPGVYEPFRCPKWLGLTAHETEYEVENHKPPCPSLTEGSTLSRSSSATKLPTGPFTRSPIPLPKSRVPLKRGRSKISMEAQKDSTGYAGSYIDFPKLPRTETEEVSGQHNESKRPINNSRLEAVTVGKTNSLPKIESNVQAELRGLDGVGSLDSGTPTDCSSDDDDDDEYDPFESLNQAIRRTFSSNPRLADRVIDYLIQLPPGRRARVYGYGSYGSITSYPRGNQQNPPSTTGYGENPRPTKRRRADEVPSNDQRLNQLLGSNDRDDRVLVDHLSPAATHAHRRFACGYNIFDREKYSPRSTMGRTATQYKSCAGPGFVALNHYKRHLERVHIIHQCPRCGSIFAMSGELQEHLAQSPRCPEIEFEREGGMSQAKWDRVKAIFKRSRRGPGEASDEERWFLAWDELFPGVERPPTAYFEEPQLQGPYSVMSDRVPEIFGALLTSQPRLASIPNYHGDILEALRQSFNIVGRDTLLGRDFVNPNALQVPAWTPTINGDALDDTLNINQTGDSMNHPPDPGDALLGTMDPVGGMSYQYIAENTVDFSDPIWDDIIE